MKQTAGQWDPSEKGKFFLVCIAGASAAGWVGVVLRQGGGCLGGNVLMPFYYAEKEREALTHANSIMLDSGAFAVASEAGKALGVNMGTVFGMPLSQVPGGQKMLDAYETTVTSWGNETWGYVEFDIGSVADRAQRRQRQESRGIRPIPVYSAMNDPESYFLTLLRTYDRVCIGSIARMPRQAKIIMLSHLEGIYRRSGSTAWVHLLGCSPGPSTSWAHSMDSSTWSNLGMFGATQMDFTQGGRLAIPSSFNRCPRMGELDQVEDGLLRREKCLRGSAVRAVMHARAEFNHRAEIESA